MTNTMLELYVRNQILLHPTYMGEDLVIQGEHINTTEIAKKYQEKSKYSKQDGSLELYMTAIRNNETIKIELGGKKVPMSSLVASFKDGLLDKSKLDIVIDTFMPYVSKEIKKVCSLGSGYILDDAMFIKEFSEDTCNLALQHIFGSLPSRFIYNLANKTSNGNVLDLHEDIVNRFFAIKQEFFTYASAIRAFGYGYSDYKPFIAKGILVSIDMSNRVFVVLEDYMYCMSVQSFNSVLSEGKTALPPCDKVFNTQAITLDTYAPIGGLR